MTVGTVALVLVLVQLRRLSDLRVHARVVGFLLWKWMNIALAVAILVWTAPSVNGSALVADTTLWVQCTRARLSSRPKSPRRCPPEGRLSAGPQGSCVAGRLEPSSPDLLGALAYPAAGDVCVGRGAHCGAGGHERGHDATLAQVPRHLAAVLGRGPGRFHTDVHTDGIYHRQRQVARRALLTVG
jgi:hypothetical protein